MDKAELLKLKPGDMVWMADAIASMHPKSDPGWMICKVTKVTETQIAVHVKDWYRPHFDRETGFQASGAYSLAIRSLATPEECAAYDARKKQEADAAQERARQDAELSAKRIKLQTLFPDSVLISERNQWPDSGSFDIQIRCLTELQVREIACLLANHAVKP
jgi:hypothetical protein